MNYTIQQKTRIKPTIKSAEKTNEINDKSIKKTTIVKSEEINSVEKTTTVKLNFPTQFLKYIDYTKQVTFKGENFLELLNHLDIHFDSIKERLIDEDKNEVKPYLNIFINKKNINSIDGLNTKISEGATISLLLSRAGG